MPRLLAFDGVRVASFVFVSLFCLTLYLSRWVGGWVARTHGWGEQLDFGRAVDHMRTVEYERLVGWRWWGS